MKKLISLILVLALVVASGMALATGSTTVNTSGATTPAGTTTTVTTGGGTGAAATTTGTTATTDETADEGEDEETEETAEIVVTTEIAEIGDDVEEAAEAKEKTADIKDAIANDTSSKNTVEKFLDAIAAAGDVISTSSSDESTTSTRAKYNVVNAIETVTVDVSAAEGIDTSVLYSKETKVPLRYKGLSVKKNVPTCVAYDIPGLGWVFLNATVDDDGLLTVDVPGDVLEAMEGKYFMMVVMQDDPDIAE